MVFDNLFTTGCDILTPIYFSCHSDHTTAKNVLIDVYLLNIYMCPLKFWEFCFWKSENILLNHTAYFTYQLCSR